jgi:hypothetical protein
VGVVTEEGKVGVIKSDTPVNWKSWKLDKEEKHHPDIPGKLLCSFNDPVQYKCNLFLTENNLYSQEESGFTNKKKVGSELGVYIFDEALHNITDLLKELDIVIKSSDKLIGLYEDSIHSHFLYFDT